MLKHKIEKGGTKKNPMNSPLSIEEKKVFECIFENVLYH
jgi:hypothetical protein